MSGGAVGRREVAVRLFAAEYDDANLEYSESDEERAPNYVVTPTGARVNRLFAVGVLTEVEAVSDDVLRGRVVDPTGAFVVYAGQYQPDAKTALERTEPPAFIAVTGKARTFEPDDADRVYTSIRPESINTVDADTRDRWTVQTAEQTIDRIRTFAAALEREERGDALREVLLEAGVEPALAAGVPRAIDHYGTTAAYLAAVHELAVEAAEVVAGERDEVGALELAPDEGGPVEADLTDGFALGVESTAEATASAGAVAGGGAVDAGADDGADGAAASAAASEPSAGTTAREEQAADTASGDERASQETPDTGGAEAAEEALEAETEAVEPDDAATAGAGEAGADEDDLGDFDDYGTEAEGATGEAGADEAKATAESDAAAAETDELYEMDDEEREAVEEEFGTEFSTGSEVDSPGEADIETPGAAEDAAEEEGTGTAESEERGAHEPQETEADEGDGPEAETPEADADDVDLVDAVVAAMEDLDEGDGADRGAVVEVVANEHGFDEAAVEDAVQDALMAGRCYEPGDDRLKAI